MPLQCFALARFVRIAALLLMTLGLSACMTGPRFANLEAQVVADAPLDLPPNAELSVRLVNMGSSGPDLIAEANYVRLGRGPIPVMLRYDAKAIDENDAYALRAEIRADGERVYATTEPVPVLTGGAPDSNVALPIERINR